jgi:2-polyprenyl-6-methoxyphenol hydroxylase-like FAD-dependent oxidoreductase
MPQKNTPKSKTEADILPVLIVGSGPAGLMLALELAHQDIPFRIIDGKAGLTASSNAIAVHSRSLEIFATRGLDKKLIAQGLKAKANNIYYSNELLARIKLDNDEDNPYNYALMLEQNHTEQVIVDALKTQAVKIEFSTTLKGLRQYNSHSVAMLEHKGKTEKVSAAYVVGCDGFNSTVRQKSHIDYLGKDLGFHALMMDVPIESKLKNNELQMFLHAHGILMIFPLKDKVRIIADIMHDPEFNNVKEATPDIMNAIIARRAGMTIKLGEPVWTSSFYIHERLAKNYRKHRVFLTGDAAHAHSPAGGQGMNTGLQDAHNLGWKLAGVIRGELDVKILKTYQSERRPVAKHVLSMSARMTKMASLKNLMGVMCRNLFIKHVFNVKKLQARLTRQITEQDIAYPGSRLTGDLSPHQKGRGQFSKLNHANCRFKLFVLPETIDKEVLQSALEEFKDKIDIEFLSDKQEARIQALNLKKGFCLVRPDQYIALHAQKVKSVKAYLKRWLA